jgi:hypothetical protein
MAAAEACRLLALMMLFGCCCCRHTQRTGSTVLRDRLLEVKGFAVLCLPYWDIEQQKQAGGKAMLAWMEGLLVKAAATPPPRSSSGDSSSGRVDLEAYRSTL